MATAHWRCDDNLHVALHLEDDAVLGAVELLEVGDNILDVSHCNQLKESNHKIQVEALARNRSITKFTITTQLI